VTAVKRTSCSLPELFYAAAFLLWLTGSSIAHIKNGVELSLWLMTFAILISFATTVFPWLGIRWLRLKRKGCRGGWWLALCLQCMSWGTFAYAMFQRLKRSLPQFHLLITLVTLLWASWLLVFIYSRHACRTQPRDDKLDGTTDEIINDQK
jgi:Na+/proline symporter